MSVREPMHRLARQGQRVAALSQRNRNAAATRKRRWLMKRAMEAQTS